MRQIISKHIATTGKQARILDLGCGHGAFMHSLRESGYQNVLGVDVSEEQIALARSLGIPGVVQSDLTTFLRNRESASADVILMMDILEHLTREEELSALDEVFRVLTPKGRCILHVPNAEGLWGMRIRYGDMTHEQCFTRSSVRQLLRTVGFQTVRCYEEKPIPHGTVSMVRRTIWELGTIWARILLASETGSIDAILSQNLLAGADK